jgi:competence protein ComEC
MVKVSEWAAAIQPLILHVRAPDLVHFTVYYAVLIAVFSRWIFRTHLRKWAAGAMVAAVVPLTVGDWWRSDSVLTVLPLAGGSAVYVKHGDEWLVDCGDLESARHITKPFLQSRGVNRLPHLLLTHGDVRHVEAAPLIHDLFSTRNIYMSALRFRSRPYRLVQDYFRTNNIAVNTLLAGDRIGLWRVLHPDADSRFSQADDNAMVLFASIHTHRVLLLSDLGIAGQNALLQSHPDLKADIIVTGLPRESDPIADGFIESIKPSLIIVADSDFPASERASDRLRARLAKHRIPIVYTSDSGAVTLKFRRERFAIQTMNSSESD